MPDPPLARLVRRRSLTYLHVYTLCTLDRGHFRSVFNVLPRETVCFFLCLCVHNRNKNKTEVICSGVYRLQTCTRMRGNRKGAKAIWICNRRLVFLTGETYSVWSCLVFSSGTLAVGILDPCRAEKLKSRL